MSSELRQSIFNNVLWLAGSLVIGLVVWFVATLEADPVNQRRFPRVPIQIQMDDDMIITNTPQTTAQVFISAQQSVLDILSTDDITLEADLSGLAPGTHTVPITSSVARSARLDTQPTQITVAIEAVVSEQKNVEIVVDEGPPPTYTFEIIEHDVFQAEVSGAPSRVDTVAQVVAVLDLSGESNDFEINLPLLPVNENGARVEDVDVAPRTVNVSVDMILRDDVRRISVRPFILSDTLSDNYIFRDVDYEPRNVLISGLPESLERLPDPIDTQPISLEGRTGSFTVDVPIDLPATDDELIPLSESTITVNISLEEQTTSLSLQNIPVNVIGVPETWTAQVNPERISMLLNGPVTQLQGITEADVQVVIDANGLPTGTSEVTPTVSIRQGQVNLAPSNITLLPETVSITLQAPDTTTTPAADATPQASATPTPTGTQQ